MRDFEEMYVFVILNLEEMYVFSFYNHKKCTHIIAFILHLFSYTVQGENPKILPLIFVIAEMIKETIIQVMIIHPDYSGSPVQA